MSGRAVLPSQGARENDRELSRAEALKRVERALQHMQYGEVVVKVEAGKPIWVDRHERERVG